MFLGKISKINHYTLKLKLDKKGLSLIETITALTILIMGVVYLVSFFPYGLKAAKTSEQETVAVNLAQAKIEEIISTPYGELAAGENLEASLAALDDDFANFSRLSVISYVDADLNQSEQDLGLKKTVVTVAWLDRLKNSTSTVTLSTLIADF